MDNSNNKVPQKFSFDLRWVVGLLVVVILVMLFIWKPWTTGNDRTVEVTGEATVTATPDEFIFYPTYQFTNTDKNVAMDELTAKTETVTAELKKLGVDEKDIKTSSSGYENMATMPTPASDSKGTTYTSQLTITVDNQGLAQKVQDYLVTTNPTGGVSPTPTFSDAKQKELEAQARDEATKDAHAKAEQSGENLGFTIGKVKSVNDGNGFAVPYGRETTMAVDSQSANSFTIYPGENQLPYSVTVVYYIR